MNAAAYVDVLGVRVTAASVRSATDEVTTYALAGAGGYVCLCNVHVLMTAKGHMEVREALESARAVFADGGPIAWLQRRSGCDAERVAGPDLFAAVISEGRAQGLRHFLFGASESVLAGLTSELQSLYPGVRIVGAIAPPVASHEQLGGRWVEQIRASRPHIIWCALGAPKQELWANRFAAEVAPSLIVGVGAAFEFVAGTKTRAPMWMQRAGLEWLHRLAQEPRRLAPRYLSSNAQFAALVVSRMVRRTRVSSAVRR
jgi:N-acetylglucosaminyldiphosphoundecaprenol N-acetyl-beta-D-mannosaminyltransferase